MDSDLKKRLEPITDMLAQAAYRHLVTAIYHHGSDAAEVLEAHEAAAMVQEDEERTAVLRSARFAAKTISAEDMETWKQVIRDKEG